MCESVNLDYNQLKLLILRTVSECGSVSSEEVGNHLITRDVRVEIHAIRMALMRYHRQGLLLRKKTEGSFSYALSERGTRRLKWLETTNIEPRADPRYESDSRRRF